MHSTSDASLLFAAARSRDGDAMAELAQRYVGLIYSVAMRITSDAPLARKLTTDLMAAIATEPERVRGEPAVWIHEQITRRSHETGTCPTRAARSDLAEEPHWHELAPEVDRALLRMNSRLRTVVIQHYCQRHSQDELAAMLQVTQPVVGKRLRKGLDVLRGKLVDAGAGCSLGHLMMLLARHGASSAPADVLAEARETAIRNLEVSASRRSGWLGILTVWAIVAGLVAAVAMSYSRTDDAAEATTTTMPSHTIPSR